MRLGAKILDFIKEKTLLGKLLRGVYGLKIRYKLVLSYYLITIIPISAIGVFSYNLTVSYIKSQNVVTMTNTQQQFKMNVTSRLNNYIKIADTIYYNQKIQKIVDSNYSNYYEEYDLITNYLVPVLVPLLESTGKNVNMDLIKYNNLSSEVLNNNFNGIISEYERHSDFETVTKSYNIYNIDRVENRTWFKQIKDKVEGHTWMQVGDDAIGSNISLLRPLISFTNFSRNHIGMLKITVRLNDIVDDGNSSGILGDEFHMVYDEKGKLLSVDGSKQKFYTQNSRIIDQLLASKENSMFLKDYVIIKDTIDLTGWKIMSVNSIKKMNENAKKIRDMTVIYCLASSIVLLLITYLLSASFSKRITRISSSMNKFQSGNFEDLEIVDKHTDEIGYLASSFNEMTGRIDSLIRDNYQANLDKKEAQLKALQAQINPHFLYNSLSCISRLGNIKDAESISKMVKALTVFYRMTLNKGRDIIKISDELDQIKAYIDIFKIRKGEDFNAYFRIDREVLDYYTVKVILQPFIENILEHGVYDRDNPITIIVSAVEEGNDIVFKIIDDGIGIKKERIEAIFSNDHQIAKGYGIRNVDARIKLHFGSQYGVKIVSRQGIGTSVIIVIPKHWV